MPAESPPGRPDPARARSRDPERYKWLALSNTTLGVLLATIDSSIMLIAMPDVFRGIKLDPLAPGNSFYPVSYTHLDVYKRQLPESMWLATR